MPVMEQPGGTDSGLVLVRTTAEAWKRFAGRWLLLAGIAFVGFFRAEEEDWRLLGLGLVIAAIGLYEFLMPDRLVLGPWRMEVVRNGRRIFIPWREVRDVVSSEVGGRVTVLRYGNSEGTLGNTFVALRHGYGHSREELAEIIRQRWAEVVPPRDGEPRLDRRRNRRLENIATFGLPFLFAAIAVLLWLLGFQF